MSKAPSMPVFPDALIADTTDLNMEEFGAYCMILMVTWRNNGQPLLDDATRMSRVCRMSERRWADRIRPVLARYFDLSEGVWRQGRLEKEWNYVAKLRGIQSAKGKLSAEAKALKNKETTPTAVDERLQPDSNPHTHTHTQEELTLEADASRDVAAKPDDEPIKVDKCGAVSIDTLKAMAVIWRDVCGDVLPVPRTLDKARQASLRRRYLDTFERSLDCWKDFCQRVRGSPFLTGENKSGWRADLDFMLKPVNANKLLEGGYDDHKPRQQQRTQQSRSPARSFGVDDDAGIGGILDGLAGELDASGAGPGFRAH